MPKKCFGSIRVEVSIGDQIWNTLVFPDKSSGSYLWPIKQSVRKAVNIAAGSIVNIRLIIIDINQTGVL
jgi:hypothetical protein